MSVYDLMNAVRSGEFQAKFKECNSTEDKIALFKNYGVIISMEQYKEIELKVFNIKSGKDASYDSFEKEVKGDGVPKKVEDFELTSVSAGKGGRSSANVVLEVLKRMPDEIYKNSTEKKDDDIKLWETKPYLTGRGLF